MTLPPVYLQSVARPAAAVRMSLSAELMFPVRMFLPVAPVFPAAEPLFPMPAAPSVAPGPLFPAAVLSFPSVAPRLSDFRGDSVCGTVVSGAEVSGACVCDGFVSGVCVSGAVASVVGNPPSSLSPVQQDQMLYFPVQKIRYPVMKPAIP